MWDICWTPGPNPKEMQNVMCRGQQDFLRGFQKGLKEVTWSSVQLEPHPHALTAGHLLRGALSPEP